MHKTAQTFHFIVSKQPPTVKLLSPTSSKVLEPPLVRTPPGLQPHLRGFCPQTPAKPISSLLPQKDLHCCLQDTNALHFLPSLFSGKLLQHQQQRVKQMFAPQGIVALWGFFLSSIPFPQCLIPVMKSTFLALKPALTYLGCSCPPAARQLPSYSAWRDLRYNY